MNIKIQKLIAFNESLHIHYSGNNLSEDELTTNLVLSSKLLQELSKSALDVNQELNKKDSLIKGTLEVKKMLTKSLFDKQESDANNLEVQYCLSNGYNELKRDNKYLKLENAQLKAELELIKEKQIKEF